MMNKLLFALTLTGALHAGAALAADADACLGCHAADEFAGLSVDEVLEVVQDPSVMAHKPFADFSEDELRAIAASLTGAS